MVPVCFVNHVLLLLREAERSDFNIPGLRWHRQRNVFKIILYAYCDCVKHWCITKVYSFFKSVTLQTHLDLFTLSISLDDLFDLL